MSNLFKSPANAQTPSAAPPMPDVVPSGDPPPPADHHGSFPDADQAAIAALDHINRHSIRDNVEYAGLIYRRGPNDFDFTGPHRGTAGKSDPYTTAAPAATATVGTYHTHGDYSILRDDGTFIRSTRPISGDYEGDSFATEDYASHRRMGGTNQRYTSYLGTPSGAYLSWNPFRDPQTKTIATRPRPRM
jgi:hypothetical protein